MAGVSEEAELHGFDIERRFLQPHLPPLSNSSAEYMKTKKATFKDESKKKSPKNPFDLEGLQKFLKSMSNEMV